MADQSFDRVILNARERPLSSDLNQMFSREALTLREVARLANLSGNGFFGDSFFATATGTSLQLQLAAGIGFIYDGSFPATNIDSISGLSDPSSYAPLALSGVQTITLAAAPSSGNERYDLIEVKPYRRRTDTTSRDVLNVTSGAFEPTSVLKTLAYDLYGNVGTVLSPAASTSPISIKQGVDAPIGTASVPSGTSGYTPVAVVYVPASTTTLTNKIRDMRRILYGLGQNGMLGGVIAQTIGTPDVLSIVSSIDRPSSLKIGVKSLGSAANDVVRVYLIHGDLSARSSVVSSHPMRYSGSGAQDLIDRLYGVATGSLSSGDATILQGAPSSLVVAPGQPYLYFDIQSVSVSGASILTADVLRHHFSVLV